MKRISTFIVILCVYALEYMVLAEDINWLNFGIGLAISFAAITFSSRYLLFDKYASLFPVKFFGFLIYFFYLMAKVMESGIKAAALTIKGRAELKHEHFISTLPNNFALNLLANSITLTPGTVTVNRNGDDLFIMQLCKEGEEFSMDSVIEFENRIKKLVIRESE